MRSPGRSRSRPPKSLVTNISGRLSGCRPALGFSIPIKLQLRPATIHDGDAVRVLKTQEIILEPPSGLHRHYSVVSRRNMNLELALAIGNSLVVAILSVNLNCDARKVGGHGMVASTISYKALNGPTMAVFQGLDDLQRELCFFNRR